MAEDAAVRADVGKSLLSPAGVSVFIMTHNEECNIKHCLDAVMWCDDIVVLDSYSSDATVNIASRYSSVRVVHRRFTNYADQRNFGLHQVRYANPWVLVVDADEMVEPGLAREVLAIAKVDAHSPGSVSAYLLRRKVVYRGRTLRRNLTATFWIPRLVRPREVSYYGLVHERVEAQRGFGKLRGTLQHHQFRKGIADWRERRRRYARLEWEMARNGQCTAVHPRDVLGTHLQRRSLAKAVFMAIPARWLIYLLVSLIVMLPFLEGATGLRYVLLEALSYREADRIKRKLRHAETCTTSGSAAA